MTSPRRVSMGQRSAQGVAGYHHGGDNSQTSNGTESKPPTPTVTAGEGSTTRETETARLSVYWRGTTLDDARRAYMADIDTQPDGPTSFARWIDRAVIEHAHLTAKARAHIATTLGEQAQEDARPRSFAVQPSTIKAMRDAIATDRTPGVPAQTRSDFVADAVRQSTSNARNRWGKELPPAPARLPNRRWD